MVDGGSQEIAQASDDLSRRTEQQAASRRVPLSGACGPGLRPTPSWLT